MCHTDPSFDILHKCFSCSIQDCIKMIIPFFFGGGGDAKGWGGGVNIHV